MRINTFGVDLDRPDIQATVTEFYQLYSQLSHASRHGVDTAAIAPVYRAVYDRLWRMERGLDRG